MHLNTRRLPPSGLLMSAGYVLLWLLLWPTVQPYWMLPYGLQFGAFLLTPVRFWGWLLGAQCVLAAEAQLILGMPSGSVSLVALDLAESLIVAAGLWLVRWLDLHASLHRPQELTRLLLSVLAIVLATAAVDAGFFLLLHSPVAATVMLQSLGQQLLGHYLAILLITPIMVMLLRTRFDHGVLSGLLRDGVLVMLPSMVLLLLLSEGSDPQPQFARILSLAPVLFFAFRHGWRGASLSMLISSLGLTLLDQRLGQAPPGAATYLFLAVAGTGALMLGSATDALRRSSRKVAEQNVYLGAVNGRLDQLAQQLRAAARGNLQADENQRRHLAAELHDELGQNITAIQTHVKLAQSRLKQAGMEDTGVSINAILGHMRRALRRLLDDLRPALLDEFGLMRALDEGPIRDLLNAAGVRYRTTLHGDPRLLDDDTLTALYRLVQESATNTVKHARASEFRLRLRIGERQGTALALLDLRDDGVGLPDQMPRGGRGLQGMRDRVTSLGGQFRLRGEQPGVHLKVLLRAADSSPARHREGSVAANAETGMLDRS